MNQESGMLGTREDVIATMYSVFFQQDAQMGQFVIGPLDDFLKDINQYSHAIITTDDWSSIPADMRDSLSKNHRISNDKNDELVLIKQQVKNN